MNERSGWKALLLLILFFALVIRVWAARSVHAVLAARQHAAVDGEARGERNDDERPPPFLFGDSLSYWELGSDIAHGREYAVGDPPRRVLRMPGFPLLLAAVIGVVGEDVQAVRVVLALLGTACCALVFWLGSRVFGLITGLVAAGFAAIYPAFVLFSVVVLSETMFAALMLVNLVLLLGWVRSLKPGVRDSGFTVQGHERRTVSAGRHWLWALGCGAAAGAATLVRPSWLVFVPVFATAFVGILLWRDRKQPGPEQARGARPLQAVGSLAVMAAATAALLAPWTARNYAATGHFVPTTLWVGASLYDGLNPRATGASDMGFFDEAEAEGRLAGMSELERDRYWRRQAWRFVREHPWRTVELAAIKFVRYWNLVPNAEEFRSPLERIVYMASYGPILALAIAGFITRRRRGAEVWLLVLPVLYFCAIHMVFVSSLRYQLPGMYALMPLSAAGAADCWSALRRRRRRKA